MHQAIAPSLEAWASFYVIVGSSAGALTGLQFVVMTLISASGRTGGLETISAFGSPNVVHFCASLLVASVLSIPWRGLHAAGVAVALSGALGVVYVLIVMRRAARQRTYQPVFEDWLWHVALPILAYAVLFVAGGVLAGAVPDSLFFIGPAALLLVFIGIHNAWDTVTFLTATSGQPSPPPPSGPPATPGE